MTKVKSISELGSLYESVRNNSLIIEEKKHGKKFPKGTFLGAHEDAKEPKTFKDSGPGAALKGAKATPKKKSKKNTRKTVKEDINSFMKSKFDRLFENVMDDDKDLDLGAGPKSGPEGEAGDLDSELDIDLDSDLGEDLGGDEVTLTLDKETAQKLIDVLQAAIGGEEDLGGEESDLEDLEIEDEDGGEDEFDFGSKKDEDEEDYASDEDEENYFETTEAEKLPDTAGQKLTKKDNEVPGHVKAAKGKASSQVTDEVGSSNLGDTVGHNLTKPGNNKVGNLKTGKSLF